MAINARKVRFGWCVNGEGQEVKDPEQQKIIKDILKWASEHESHASIARQLNERGVKAQRGGTWRGNIVSKIIEANRGGQADKPLADERPLIPFPAEETQQKELANNSGFWWDRPVFDAKTGETEIRREWIGAEEYKSIEEQVEKIRNMTLAERTEAFSFYDMCLFSLGEGEKTPIGGGPAEIVKELTGRTGRDVHVLIDEIKDQPGVKAKLRQAVKFLLNEIAIQRHVNLSLRQKSIAPSKFAPPSGQEQVTRKVISGEQLRAMYADSTGKAHPEKKRLTLGKRPIPSDETRN
jgi:hypothetical protein